MTNNKIEMALKKYPKAKRIAVESFTSFGTATMGMAESMNLEMDAKLYNWNSHTVSAIRMVMK
jgi:hypothetical protein